MFINADIILPINFLDIINPLYKKLRRFLMVGHRWDMEVDYFINFNNESKIKSFWKNAQNNSKKHACTGIDYFIFRKETFKNLPDFAIGRPGYDNWLLWHARRRMLQLIDASSEIHAIHQNHHFNFHNLLNNPKIKDRNNILEEEDGIRNRTIIGKNHLNLLDTNYFISDGIVKRKKSMDYVNRNLGKLSVIFPEFSLLFKIYKKIYRRLFVTNG
tara:strand:+ start:832 stop:1476 length:645 start_codon:yes stop_codon:yes gene_type:complete